MYKRELGRYRLQQGLLRSQHKNTQTPKQAVVKGRNGSAKESAKGSAKGSTDDDEQQQSQERQGHAGDFTKARSNEKERGERVDHILNSMRMTQPHLLISAFLALARLSCRPLLDGIQLLSVDGFQGDEAPFLIIDPVTPGAPDHTLGFLKDLERLCVALSRAQDGLSIVGNNTMADADHQMLVVKAWRSLIQYFKDVNGCITHDFGRGARTRWLLKIPGTAYKAVAKRSEYVD